MSNRTLRVLDGLKLLADVPAAARTRLVDIACPVRYAAGDAQFHRGDAEHGMLAVPDGRARISQGHIATRVAASRPKVSAALADYRPRGLVGSVRAGLMPLDHE